MTHGEHFMIAIFNLLLPAFSYTSEGDACLPTPHRAVNLFGAVKTKVGACIRSAPLSAVHKYPAAHFDLVDVIATRVTLSFLALVWDDAPVDDFTWWITRAITTPLSD